MARWKRSRRNNKKKNKDDGEAAITTDAAAADGSTTGDTTNNNNNNNNTASKRQQKKSGGNHKQPDEPGRGRRNQLYNMIDRGCLRMETYYAVQGLHNSYWDEETDQVKPCETDQEKELERQRWITHMKSILPSSFRLGNDVEIELRQRLEQELDQLVGSGMEIFVETNEGGQQKRRTDTKSNTNNDNSNPGIDQAENVALDKQGDEDGTAQVPNTDDTMQVENDEQPQAAVDASVDDDMEDPGTVTDAATASTATLIRKTVAPAKKIPYVPHAYQISLDRNTIRRNPCLQQFHNWLKVQTAAGFITRQETVSMIPPVVLSPESHHIVLDLCAAPGSKTSQLLEVVSLPTAPTDHEPRGCVVANDADPKRAHMLVHQMRRINSPAVLVTNCDAQFFPMLRNVMVDGSSSGGDYQEGMFDRVLCDVPCTGDGTARKNPHMWREWTQGAALSMHPLQLNIALQGARLTKVGGYMCYSTCSMNPIENEAVVAELLRQSKGALQLVEKRPDLTGLRARPGWSTWKVMREVQYRKERRKNENYKRKQEEASKEAPAVVKNEQGGYDKVEAMNENEGGGDIEDEVVPAVEEDDDVVGHVVAEDDNEEPVTVGESDLKPPADSESKGNQNERQQRISRLFEPPNSWDDATLSAMAADSGFVEFKSVEDLPETSQKKVRSSCFPPTAEEAAVFGLEKCLRCLPQDMDTGGFFVALLQKVAPMRAAPRKFKAAAAAAAAAKTADATSKDEPSELLEPELKRAKIDDLKKESTLEENGVLTAEAEASNAEEKSAEETAKENDGGWDSKNKKGNLLPDKDGVPIEGVGRDDFIPVSDEIMIPLINYYGLSADFPKEQLMARAGGEAHKVLYFISRSIKTLFDLGIQKRLTVINSGLKTFAKNNNHCDCGYRVAQEGIHLLVPYMTKRKIVAELDDFTRCLEGPHALPIDNFSNPFAEAVRPLDVGSFVVVLQGYEGDFSRKMIVVMWRGRGDTLKSLVSRVETAGFKSKLRAIAGEPFSWKEIEQDTSANGDGEWHKLP